MALKRDHLPDIFAILTILLFSYTFTSKVLVYSTFLKEIDNQPLPNSWTPTIAIFILVAELVIVALLSFSKTRRGGFVVSALFFLFFTIYTIVILADGFSFIPCPCGGVIEHLSWPQHLLLDLVFLGLSLSGIILLRRKKDAQRHAIF